MSRENVELVREALAPLAGQDVVAWFAAIEEEDLRGQIEALYAPDAEIIWLEGNPDQRPYRGREEIAASFSDWLDAWETFHFEPQEPVDAGDAVLVRNTQRGRGKASGAEIELTSTMVVTVREGQIASIQEFADHADALEAAGLQV